MRFPSIDLLARHAVIVLRRFPWTLAAGALAAFAAVTGSLSGADRAWGRLAFVAALGLPLTTALTLLGEQKRWPTWLRHVVLLGGALLLGAFFLDWPGIERRQDAIRYFQLSAALHLAVAFLPYLGASEGIGFWQYNRRLFLGFLRALVFSAVLFVGIAVALGALDKLFGVDVDGETYVRIWFVLAFLVNTWIFLAVVPERLDDLGEERDYPRALKIFAQYILTPLAFTYLVILLAYLIKIVAGGEWPSGWIGWLVASVSVTGLLGFLLVHPLRAEPDEAWIRTYARWLFIGLIPAALMLLVAFWKRIVPYGLTELRVLGIVLGLWLLGIALLYTLRRGTGIRTIPVTLSVVLLLTLYGPLSLTSFSIRSQAARLQRMLRPETADAREASAALRFLIDHRAGDAIAGAIGRELPPVNWAGMSRWNPERDSLGQKLMALAGAEYVPEYRNRSDGWFHVASSGAIDVSDYTWAVPVTSNDPIVHVLEGDTISVLRQAGGDAVARVRAGADTLAFDLTPAVRRYADSMPLGTGTLTDRILIEEASGRNSALAISSLNGRYEGDSLSATFWMGTLLLGR